MNGAELKELAAKAQAAYEAMTPLQKAQHDLAQRRSFMRGSCPSSRNYEEWCEHVDEALKSEPAFVLLAEIDRQRRDRLDCQVVMDSQQAEIERLQAAAERVVWFDWSGNDPDAVAAVDELRRVLQQTAPASKE